MTKKYSLTCEHGVLATYCKLCKMQIEAVNSDSMGAWEALILTKERQYPSTFHVYKESNNYD